MADDGASWLDGLNFFVTDRQTEAVKAPHVIGGAAKDVGAGAAAGSVAASVGGSGGGFAMSADEMTTMLNQAKRTRDKINDQIRSAGPLAQCLPPGSDQASVKFTNGPNGANDVGNHYLGHLQIQYNRYTSLIEKLEKALGITVDTDQQAADASQQAGREGKY